MCNMLHIYTFHNIDCGELELDSEMLISEARLNDEDVIYVDKEVYLDNIR